MAEDEVYKPRWAVIVVEQSFSWCSACGKRVIPSQFRHTDIAGDWRLINPGEVEGGGCGAQFAAITAGTWGLTVEDLKDIRAGLPAIPGEIVHFAKGIA